MLLGVYHPRHLLLTTPSYTFNARFTPPDVTERCGYLDPTGRTNRIFRHHDHKFEWTVEEFKEWCEAAAEEWGYEVVVETIGRALEKDPWGREEECGGASQVAEFTRKEGKEFVEMRKAKSAAMVLKTAEGERHELLATHQHTAHASSERPLATLREISNAVIMKMEELEESLLRFEELWFEQEIAILCGGWIELLKNAVEDDERLMLRKENSIKRDRWQVELIGGVQKRAVWADDPLLIDGPHKYEDPEDQDQDEEDSDHEWDSASVEEPDDQIMQDWGASGSVWGELKSWRYAEDDKQMGEEDGSMTWGNAQKSWGTISSGTTITLDSGRG